MSHFKPKQQARLILRRQWETFWRVTLGNAGALPVLLKGLSGSIRCWMSLSFLGPHPGSHHRSQAFNSLTEEHAPGNFAHEGGLN